MKRNAGDEERGNERVLFTSNLSNFILQKKDLASNNELEN